MYKRQPLIEKLAKRDFAAGSNIVTDGLACWKSVTKAGCDHFPMITGSGSQAARWAPFTRWAPFKWVNTALGNIKTALAGTYHPVSYTHLDVYKRQRQNHSPRPAAACRPVSPPGGQASPR